MSKYQEQTVSGQEYQRCYRIVIWNPYQQAPEVLFEEEGIFKKSDGSTIHNNRIAENGGVIKKTVNDLNESFNVYDPVTQQKTGEVAQLSTVYGLIWSVYMNEALKRDAEAAKQKILFEFNKWNEQARQTTISSIANIHSAVDSQEPALLNEAIILAATKVTEEEKKAVMDAYEADKQFRKSEATAQGVEIMQSYTRESSLRQAQAEAEAQAAYDQVING